MKRTIDGGNDTGPRQRSAFRAVMPAVNGIGTQPNMVARPTPPGANAQAFFAPPPPPPPLPPLHGQLQPTAPGIPMTVQTTVPILAPGNASATVPKSARKSAASVPKSGHMTKWLSIKAFEERVAAMTAPAHCKLPANTDVKAFAADVPLDVLKQIPPCLEGRDLQAFALTCNRLYQHCSETTPLRLGALMKLLLPAGCTQNPARIMLTTLLDMFQEGSAGLDQKLYAPMGGRLRAALTLALAGAIPYHYDKEPDSERMDNAIVALGNDALLAFSDLLNELLQQSETVFEGDIGYLNEVRNQAPTRILRALQPVFMNAPPPATGAQALTDLARLGIRFPFYLDRSPKHMVDQLITSRPEIFGPTLLALLVLAGYQDSLPAGIVLQPAEKIQAALSCLSELTRFAAIANRQLRKVAAKADTSGTVKFFVRPQSQQSRIASKLTSILHLSPEDEKALIAPHLRLLAIEVDNLALDNRVLPHYINGQEAISHITGWLYGLGKHGHNILFAHSIALRMGQLTRLAIELRPTRPELIGQLQAIVEQWPEALEAGQVIAWFKQQTSKPAA